MPNRLPIRPAGADSMTPEQAKAAAWESLWAWAEQNGLPEFSFLRQERYGKLNGPEMIAQWIIDLAERREPDPEQPGPNECQHCRGLSPGMQCYGCGQIKAGGRTNGG